ncbi:unnamed protein product [Ectocarpus sp. 4 AP-2014]
MPPPYLYYCCLAPAHTQFVSCCTIHNVDSCCSPCGFLCTLRQTLVPPRPYALQQYYHGTCTRLTSTFPTRTRWELALIPTFRHGRIQRHGGRQGTRRRQQGCGPTSRRNEIDAPPSSSSSLPGQEPVKSGVKMDDKAKMSRASVDVSAAGVDVARTGDKGKRKRKREDPSDEPLLEGYASRHSEPESPCLAGVREATNKAQPGGAHMVSGHLQGELLKLLTTLSGAKRVLDIGTFTGYSAIAFAEALPEDGMVVTLESDARAAETARDHFASSRDGTKIRLMLGQAMDTIDQLIEDEEPPQFDIIFIDADKKRYWDCFERVLSGPRPLLAPAGLLLADNVLFHELVPLAEAMGTVTTGEGQQISPPAMGGGGARAVAVGAGVLAPTPRRMKIAESLDRFNKRVKEDGRVEVLMLPLRDGLSVVRWRAGGYPTR